ncbi:polyketide synthase [Lutimaribacter marinistellae]|uniref:Polyketide synthase n=1 Tax=Lutimaribacter marinistellae TaxID=1820329 RepID=A0ABV7TFZ2_9RHOB
MTVPGQDLSRNGPAWHRRALGNTCEFVNLCYPDPAMKLSSRIIPLRALVVLLVVALATTGFAHRFLTPSQAEAMEFAVTFGLDASGICGDAGDMGAAPECGACLLHAAMSLPEPAVAVIIAELSLDPAEWVPQPLLLHELTAESIRPARAPPIV